MACKACFIKEYAENLRNVNPHVVMADLSRCTYIFCAGMTALLLTTRIACHTWHFDSVVLKIILIPGGLSALSWAFSRWEGLKAHAIIHSLKNGEEENRPLMRVIARGDLFTGYTFQGWRLNGQFNPELFKVDLYRLITKICGLAFFIGVGMMIACGNQPTISAQCWGAAMDIISVAIIAKLWFSDSVAKDKERVITILTDLVKEAAAIPRESTALIAQEDAPL